VPEEIAFMSLWRVFGECCGVLHFISSCTTRQWVTLVPIIVGRYWGKEYRRIIINISFIGHGPPHTTPHSTDFRRSSKNIRGRRFYPQIRHQQQQFKEYYYYLLPQAAASQQEHDDEQLLSFLLSPKYFNYHNE
jgi:hypothetical protein